MAVVELRNALQNPLTGAWLPTRVASELKTSGEVMPGVIGIRMNDGIVRTSVVVTVRDVTADVELREVDTAPANGQFYVDYSNVEGRRGTGIILLASNTDGNEIDVSYDRGGSVVNAEHINTIDDALDANTTAIAAQTAALDGNTASLQGQINSILGREGTGEFDGWTRIETFYRDIYVLPEPHAFNPIRFIPNAGAVDVDIGAFDETYSERVSNALGDAEYGESIITFIPIYGFRTFSVSNIEFNHPLLQRIRLYFSGTPPNQEDWDRSAGVDAFTYKLVMYIKRP